MSENFYKALLIFGVGFGIFYFSRPKYNTGSTSDNSDMSGTSMNGFDSSNVSSNKMENAKLVMSAFEAALAANEEPMTMSRLNRECMKEYGLRFYQKSNGSLAVCDLQGKQILTK